jgi:hypothetical protein
MGPRFCAGAERHTGIYILGETGKLLIVVPLLYALQYETSAASDIDNDQWIRRASSINN